MRSRFLASSLIALSLFSFTSQADENVVDGDFVQIPQVNYAPDAGGEQHVAPKFNYKAPEDGVLTLIYNTPFVVTAGAGTWNALHVEINGIPSPDIGQTVTNGTSAVSVVGQIKVRAGDNLTITDGIDGAGYWYPKTTLYAYMSSTPRLEKEISDLTSIINDLKNQMHSDVITQVQAATSTTNQTFINQISNNVNSALTSDKIADGIKAYRASQVTDADPSKGEYVIGDVNLTTAYKTQNYTSTSFRIVTLTTSNAPVTCNADPNSGFAYIDMNDPNAKNYLAIALEAVAAHQKVKLSMIPGQFDKDGQSGMLNHCQINGIQAFAN